MTLIESGKLRGGGGGGESRDEIERGIHKGREKEKEGKDRKSTW